MSVANEQDDLGKRYGQALQKHWKASYCLDQLNKEIKRVQVDEMRLKRESKVALKAYAKSLCRALCDQVYVSFPRETRDIIYDYLLPSFTRSKPGLDVLSNPYLGNKARYPYESINFHDPDYVGPEMAKEIMETLLRTSKFKFDDDYRDIPEFRVTDALGVGAIPADYVLNVQVRVNCSRFGIQESREDWAPTVRRKLLSRLEHLFGFKKGTNITIVLGVEMQELEPELREDGLKWLSDVVVPHFLPSLQRLEDAEYNTLICLKAWDPQGITSEGVPSTKKWKGTLAEVRDRAAKKTS